MRYLHQILLLTLFGCLLTSLPLHSASQTVKQTDSVCSNCEKKLPAVKQTDGERVRSIAYGLVGIKEVGDNGGYWVERFLKSVGLTKGNQWCAAFVSFVLDSAKVTTMKTRSGLARHFITKNKTIKATKVSFENMNIPMGTVLVWRRGTTVFGHVGFTDKWQGKSGTTIEGNTSSGKSGSQWSGGGVWSRKRTINPYDHFRITDFALLDQR